MSITGDIQKIKAIISSELKLHELSESARERIQSSILAVAGANTLERVCDKFSPEERAVIEEEGLANPDALKQIAMSKMAEFMLLFQIEVYEVIEAYRLKLSQQK